MKNNFRELYEGRKNIFLDDWNNGILSDKEKSDFLIAIKYQITLYCKGGKNKKDELFQKIELLYIKLSKKDMLNEIDLYVLDELLAFTYPTREEKRNQFYKSIKLFLSLILTLFISMVAAYIVYKIYLNSINWKFAISFLGGAITIELVRFIKNITISIANK